MIDLRHALPHAIECGGKLYELNTDFRVWLEFLRSIEEDGIAPFSVFASEHPDGDEWIAPAMEFARSENCTPHGSSKQTRQAFDFIRDGDYIVGSFQQAYGIDLTDPGLSLHWHRFLALFRSLPEDTKMAEIMGYRTYAESKKKIEDTYKELRTAWTLPAKIDPRTIEWQKQAFGNIEYPM